MDAYTFYPHPCLTVRFAHSRKAAVLLVFSVSTLFRADMLFVDNSSLEDACMYEAETCAILLVFRCTLTLFANINIGSISFWPKTMDYYSKAF